MIGIIGNDIYFIKKYFLDRHGKDFFNDLKNEMEEAYKEQISGPIISQEKYDVTLKVKLLEVYRKKVDKKTFDDCSVQEVRSQLKGIMRLGMRVAGIRFTLDKMQSFWNKHYDRGMVKGMLDEEGNIIINVEDFPVEGEAYWTHNLNYFRYCFEFISRKKYKGVWKRINYDTNCITLKKS